MGERVQIDERDDGVKYKMISVTNSGGRQSNRGNSSLVGRDWRKRSFLTGSGNSSLNGGISVKKVPTFFLPEFSQKAIISLRDTGFIRYK